MQSRKIFVVFIVLLLLISLGLFSYHHFTKIRVVNNNRYYHVTYRESPRFMKYLNDWKVWNKDSIRINYSSKRHTVRKIRVLTTEKPQNLYRFRDNPPNESKIIGSANGTVDKDGVWTIFVHLNPSYNNKKDIKNVNGVFFWLVLKMIYLSTHDYHDPQKASDNTRKVWNEFYDYPDEWPFTVELKNN